MTFSDPHLEAAVRSALSKPTGDVTETDMLSVTSLEAASAQIVSIDGLQYARNLETLHLAHNLITDISPLAGMTRLNDLDLSYNKISSVSPLAGMDLGWLEIQHNLLDLSEGTPAWTLLTALAGLLPPLLWYLPQDYVPTRLVVQLHNTGDHVPNLRDASGFTNPIAYALRSFKKNGFGLNVNVSGVSVKLSVIVRDPKHRLVPYVLYDGPAHDTAYELIGLPVTWNGKVGGKKLPPGSYQWRLEVSKAGYQTITAKGTVIVSNVWFPLPEPVESVQLEEYWDTAQGSDTYLRYMISGAARFYISATTTSTAQVPMTVRLSGPGGYSSLVDSFKLSASAPGDRSAGPKALARSSTSNPKTFYKITVSAPLNVTYRMSVVQ